MAVANGFGGPHGPEKVMWLEGVLGDFFMHNAALEEEEVEDFLAEVMDNEFDTAVEDGSLREVSRQLLSLWAAAGRGDAVAVGQAVAALCRRAPTLQAAVAASRRGGGGDGDPPRDVEDPPGGVGDPPGSNGDPPGGNGDPPGGDDGDGAAVEPMEAMDVAPPPDPGGWTVVHRRRR